MTSSGNKLLGMVTLYHEQLIYAQGGIRSPAALSLIPLHDYLVDADKQGLRYSLVAWRAYLKRAGLPTNLPEPAYWKFTRHHDNDNNDQKRKENEKVYHQPGVRAAKGNIIDAVFFDEIEPLTKEVLRNAYDILDEAGAYDRDLTKFWHQMGDSAFQNSQIAKELASLRKRLDDLKTFWADHFNSWSYPDRVQKTRALYDAILPLDVDGPTGVE